MPDAYPLLASPSAGDCGYRLMKVISVNFAPLKGSNEQPDRARTHHRTTAGRAGMDREA
jgi:hypothetical protein